MVRVSGPFTVEAVQPAAESQQSDVDMDDDGNAALDTFGKVMFPLTHVVIYALSI